MLAGSPRARDCPGLHVGEHLFVNPLCSPAQGKLTECVQVPLVEKLLDCPGRHVWDIHFSFPQALEKFRWCKVNYFDLIRFIDYPVGNRFADYYMGDLGDYIIEALDMLDIQRGIDIDTCIQQFLDILVTFQVP